MEIVAIPLADGRLASHFGHCQQFALYSVNRETRTIESHELVPAPPHQPGLLPGWLKEHGAGLIIAGGIGGRAIHLFNQLGIEVIPGAPLVEPEQLVQNYLDQVLQVGQNLCDH